MQFVTKKTTELTREEKQGLVDLFNDVFDKERTVEEFDRQFLNNPEGYSYHTYAQEDGKMVASNTMVPSVYMVDGKPLRFVNSVDTMIAEHHRGLENFYDMIKASFGVSEKQGYDVVYGFPNDNSYELFTKLKFMKDVGKLDTYCLPFRVGGVKKGLGILNWASILFCQCWMSLSSMFASSKVCSFLIEKETESYNATRYKRMDGNYSVVHFPDLDFMYKVEDYEGVRAAFLIDVTQKSAKNFCKAAKYIWKHEKKNCDAVLYVGVLPFKNTGFIKIPRKFEPKKFNFTAVQNSKILSKKEFYDIRSWDVNLSNYDLI